MVLTCCKNKFGNINNNNSIIRNNTLSPIMESTVISSFTKIDSITSVQDTIDRLSLSLFEALRGLRDAVAPESSFEQLQQQQQQISSSSNNPHTNHPNPNFIQNPDQDLDYEDFLLAYTRNDPYVLDLLSKTNGKPPRSREEYLKLRAKVEMEKHSTLISKLTQEILNASARIDELILNIPGMDRTKQEQMKRIQELMEENSVLDDQIRSKYIIADRKRDEIRKALEVLSCQALGISEETDDAK